ncbi:competence type IV pilus assembly protein ComGB [Salipaludibacillus daqingensis]|uniref:competence type IV pilus assembly protein ComGB n=1 Tax=Salipaludibacillus daqingensis TaxID=3041001 RepID=UPI002476D3D5|nr:competence type IV pilus assembly protein ComGB [Salipaludibacillus daqingensis]
MNGLFKNDSSRSEFLFQLSSLLNEGYSFSEAIQLYIEFSEGKKKIWVLSIYEELLEGEPFAEQLLSGGFPKELISYLLFVEKYGDFQHGLLQASIILNKRDELRKKVRKVLHYPSFLLLGLLIMSSVLIEGVLPQFEHFFTSMGQDLPWISRGMLTAATWFQWPIIFGLFLFTLVGGIWFKRKPVFEQIHFLLKVPLINTYMKHLLTYYFTSQLAPLLKNGFSLYDTLKVIEKDSLLTFFQNDAQDLSFGLQSGEPLVELIKLRPFYLPQLSSIIALGERKGNLGTELERFSNYLFLQMYEKTYRYIQFFQPLFLCLIGVFILVLFLSMMMPIFTILDGW